ncbi:MAG: hypothetical protein M3371_00850 [Acidobacteriota bacterium]|nr:hypothetical protein [Acidobacteriota bacterium]
MIEEQNRSGNTLSARAASAAKVERAADALESTKITDDEATENLLHRVEGARDYVAQTALGIKETVAAKYEDVKGGVAAKYDAMRDGLAETVAVKTLRNQVRKRPVAANAGALGVGLFVGYAIRGAFGDKKHGEYEYDGETSSRAARPDRFARSVGSRKSHKPSLLNRLMRTRMYDKFTNEAAHIGSSLIDELSHKARTVLLPAMLGKVESALGGNRSAQNTEAARQQNSRRENPAATGDGMMKRFAATNSGYAQAQPE